MSRRTDILDELRDDIGGLELTATDPEARKDMLRILGLMLALVDEVRRIDHETTKTAQDVSQHLNQ